MDLTFPEPVRAAPGVIVREAATVLCVHAFGASAMQYHGLVTRLEPRLVVRPVELYGHGRRARWSAPRGFTIGDEVAALRAAVPDRGAIHLVGHSYGAAVALRLAAALPGRVRSLALYEPAVWGTLAAWCPDEPATREIEAVRDDTNALLAAGDLEGATGRFIDYWSGPGQWAATSASRRPRLMATVQSLRAVWDATFDDVWRAVDLRAFETLPCLLMSGTASTAAARRATALLRAALPSARALDFDGLGHLGPITHAPAVDAALEAFLTAPRR